MFFYLTEIELVTINTAFLGIPAVRDRSLLDAAVGRPRAVAFYQQSDLAHQAAVFIDAISKWHGFLNANKRTATAAGLVFVQLNAFRCQYTGDAADDELGQLVVDLVIRQQSVDDCAEWLRVHLARLPSPQVFDAALHQVLGDYAATFQYLRDR